MKRYVLGVFSFFLFLPFACEAAAKDICVMSDSGIIIIFKKVADLKPADVIPLTGLYVATVSGAPFPCVGAAAMNAGGSSIQVGIYCHTMVAGNSFTWAWTAKDDTLAGVGVDDEDGDYKGEDAVTLSSVDCGTVRVP